MTKIILQTNATPVYAFLSFIAGKQSQGELGAQIKILDCGAGGPVPPLALFREHGYESYGIDTSDRQLQLARQYCTQNGLQIDLRTGDMRAIPFSAKSFDCVYEHFAMCHLSKQETATAIGEMYRVTKKRGFCFLGVISMDSWPKSFYGTEKEPGEFWAGASHHTMFTDREARELVKDWEILVQEKRVIYHRPAAEQIVAEDWMDSDDSEADLSEADVHRQYNPEEHLANYTHFYFILRKP